MCEIGYQVHAIRQGVYLKIVNVSPWLTLRLTIGLRIHIEYHRGLHCLLHEHINTWEFQIFNSQFPSDIEASPNICNIYGWFGVSLAEINARWQKVWIRI